MTSPFPCSRGCLTAAEAGCVYPDCVQATDARPPLSNYEPTQPVADAIRELGRE